MSVMHLSMTVCQLPGCRRSLDFVGCRVVLVQEARRCIYGHQLEGYKQVRPQPPAMRSHGTASLFGSSVAGAPRRHPGCAIAAKACSHHVLDVSAAHILGTSADAQRTEYATRTCNSN